MVDFGGRNDLTTVSALEIAEPGSFTDEEGTCSFRGWNGQDFENMLVEQTTYMNDYSAGKAGHSGRWIVVDYNLTSASSYGIIYGIQMMDIDLGTATDDLYAFDPDYNMTIIHQGTTYIGLAPYNGNNSFLHGHNAGEMSPDLFDGEDKIYAHMNDPNNQSTSTTAQNWYMDQVVRIPSGTFPGQFRFAFVITVGLNTADLREAYDDAKAGLLSRWNGSAPAEWVTGTIGLSANFTGLMWPPEDIRVNAVPVIGGIPQSAQVLDHTLGNRSLSFTVDIADLVSTYGTIEFSVSSIDPWGFPAAGPPFSIKCDNEEPTVAFGDYPRWQNMNYQVIAIPSDGGSGVSTTYISANGEAFRASTIATIQVESGTNSVRAYAVDNVGNVGDWVTVQNLGLDKTAPSLGKIAFSPSNVTEDTTGVVKFSVEISDPLSGVDPGSVRYRYGLDAPMYSWMPMTKAGDRYEGSASIDWNAAQGKDLYVEVMASDIAGNLKLTATKERIDPLNDAPVYTMKLTADPWEGDSIIIEFIGSDPDGDETTFEVWYRTETSAWTMPGNLLKKLSAARYSLSVPDIGYEGTLYITASASDGADRTDINPEHVTVDKKAPTLTSRIAPDAYWSRTARTITTSSSDEGSGGEIYWFDLDGSKVDGRTITIDRDGLHNVIAYVSDKAGNEDTYQFPTFGIDGTAPVISSVSISPSEVLDTDPVRLTWTMSDPTSGIAQYEAHIIDGQNTIVPEEYLTTGSIISARFPALAGGETYTFVISATDRAGNSRSHEGSLLVRTTAPPPPLNVTIPASVEVGSTYTITAMGSDIIRLHVLYPGRSEDWIMEPVRTEGDLNTFTIQAPYAFDRDIEAWFVYGPENETYPYPHANIKITGAEDKDGDGLEDSWEKKYNYDTDKKDKTSLDREGDGLNAISEMRNLTDPSFWDTDGDGMDDAWEANWGTLPFVADADGDIDGDGYTNSLEKARGSDPRDPASVPKKLPPTPWYWILIITLSLLAIIGFFAYQLISRRKFEKELEAFDGESWEDGR
jgi:hypothetical protein